MAQEVGPFRIPVTLGMEVTLAEIKTIQIKAQFLEVMTGLETG